MIVPAFAAVSALGAVVIIVAGWASTGDPTAIDRALMLALRTSGAIDDPIGGRGLESFMRDVTGLGGIGVLGGFVIAAAVLFAIGSQVRKALYLIVVSLSGWLAGHGLKLLLARPRPDLVPYGTEFWNASLPSGHAMTSAIVYLTLTFLLAQSQLGTAVRRASYAVVLLLIVVIGVSRVYLGVHWPTDVLAGWAAGAVWAWGFWRLVGRHLAAARPGVASLSQ